MKKFFSLIRASLTEGMNLFKISTKKQNNFSKIMLPIFLTLVLMGIMFSYSNAIMEILAPINMQFVLLTLFILFTSIMTIIEGIYKSGNLLFNCKDDNLLLSLPIKRSIVLFIRIFKFYVFELLYNSIFLLPSMLLYAINVKPQISFYVVSIIGLFIFPIVPILISCLIGTIITFFSSKFKGKNYVQTILTVIFLLGIMYISYNLDSWIENLAKNASNVNDFITKLYYPAGAYIQLIMDFKFVKLLEFVIINLICLCITVFVIGKVYFNINSNAMSIKHGKQKKGYKIKSLPPMATLIKKEFNRFINSTVFVTNAGFGLVLFIIGCVFIAFKFDSVVDVITKTYPMIDVEHLKNYLPTIFLGFVCFTSFMTSITSSMISLEGKSFSILKSLPIKPNKIIKAKIYTALIIMIPCILIGDVVIFIRFRFSLISISLVLISSVLLPLIAETMGIIVNLKYPRMDAKNDTEVVKQSMSSAICVLSGMAIIGLTAFLLYKAVELGLTNNFIMISFIGIYALIYFVLEIFLNKTGERSFENIL